MPKAIRGEKNFSSPSHASHDSPLLVEGGLRADRAVRPHKKCGAKRKGGQGHRSVSKFGISKFHDRGRRKHG